MELLGDAYIPGCKSDTSAKARPSGQPKRKSSPQGAGAPSKKANEWTRQGLQEALEHLMPNQQPGSALARDANHR